MEEKKDNFTKSHMDTVMLFILHHLKVSIEHSKIV